MSIRGLQRVLEERERAIRKRERDSEGIRWLVQDEGVDVNSLLWNECTALHYAAKESDVESVKVLLENNADVYATGYWSSAPLHHALTWGAAIEVVRYLLDHKAPVNEPG